MPTVQRHPRFDSSGPASGPAIVFLHGSVVTRASWRRQLETLGDDFHLVACDLPGHGSEAAVPFGFDTATDAVASLIKAEARGRALVVGLSLGGYVAIELAARHPDLAAGLVACGTSVNFVGALGTYLKVVAWLMARGVLRTSTRRLEEKTRRLFPPAMKDVAELQVRDGFFPDALAPAFAAMAGVDFSDKLRSYPGPVLILNGERDTHANRGAARFAAATPRVSHRIIPNAGHACNLDQPEAFNRALRDFAVSIGWT